MAILEGAHSSYGALLFRPEWRARRDEILRRDDYTCQFCGCQERSELQVHHRQYHYIAVWICLNCHGNIPINA